MKKLNKKGFTLVELVIVIAVIAILAAVLIPVFSSMIENANKSKDMQAARNEFELYISENAKTLQGTEDFYILSGSHWFEVTDLQFNAEPVDEPASKGAFDLTKVVTENTAASYTHTDGDYVDVLGKTATTTLVDGAKYYNQANDAAELDGFNAKVAIYSK